MEVMDVILGLAGLLLLLGVFKPGRAILLDALKHPMSESEIELTDEGGVEVRSNVR